MCEGEKSLFILPSELGFGNRGSTNSIIPPFTSLIFEVEILKVSSSHES
jgi:FKBP-type peptidyl-prolyl cis-trans isomerase